MDEQCREPLLPTRWSFEDAVKVLYQNGLKPKFNTLSKLQGGIEFQVYSAPGSDGQRIVFKYPSERWAYNDNDWGIDRFQLLRQERDLLRFAGEHGIPVPEVIACFDPHDGPVVLVLEQINVDGTLPSNVEIGETVRRLHGLSPPTLYTVAQGTQIPSSAIAALTVRRLSVIERLTESLRWKPTVEELDRLLAPINIDARLLHMDLRPANYLCRRNRLMGLIDWSNALIAAPMLELARIAEYGGLSSAFADGYKLTSDMTAALDQETGIACRLYTVVMLGVLFLAQRRLPDQAERQISRLKELLGRLEGMVAI
jgi:fructosamine-3-kinase